MSSIFGTEDAEVLTGTADADTLSGAGGNDTLQGLAGDDGLAGGAGDDSMVGGTGNDSYFVDSLGDIVVELAGGGGNDEVNASVDWTLGEFTEDLTLTGTGLVGTGNTDDNILTGSEGAQTLLGLAGNDTIDGYLGADRMEGGKGEDTYYVDDEGDQVIELAGEGIDEVVTFISWTLGDNVEWISIADDLGINITGNALNNFMQGSNSANQVAGLGGNDHLYALAGDDTLLGGDGDDVLYGGAGLDSMVGGAGDDYFYIEVAGDIVVEEADGGYDTAHANTAFVVGDHIEKFIFDGGADIEITLNDSDNLVYSSDGHDIIDGRGGADSLFGFGGADSLIGGDGDDRLVGGKGADTLVGGAGADRYTVDGSGDVIVEAAEAGERDLVSSSVSWTLGDNLEELLLTGRADLNATGNALDNTLTGNVGMNKLRGLDGNDTLFGGAGKDLLEGGNGDDTLNAGADKDLLNGGAGNDLLIGSKDDDTFFFDTALDAATNVDVIRDYGAGDDRLLLENAVFKGLAFGRLDATKFVLGKDAQDAGDRLVYDRPNGKLYYDADGRGGEAKVLFADLGDGKALSVTDIYVV